MTQTTTKLNKERLREIGLHIAQAQLCENQEEQSKWLDILEDELNASFNQYQQKDLPPKRPLTVDPFLPTGDVPVPSCSPILAVNAGIWGAVSERKGWKEKKGMGPQFSYANKEGTAQTIVEYNTTEREAAIADVLAKSLWKELAHFTDRDIDAFTIALAYSAHVKGQSVWIFGSDILEHRGITPKIHADTPGCKGRNHGHRKEDIIPYGQSFRRLSDLWVTIQQRVDTPEYDKKAKRRKQREFTHTGRLLSIEEIWYQKEFDPDTGETISGHAIGWKIRVGEWLTTFLEFPNEQIGLLAKQILNYDPHNETWPKRLAYYFFVHGHASNHGGGSVTFRRGIRDLLITASLDIDERFPQRVRDRFEKAMKRLVADRIINDWHYADPEAIKVLPTKRWLERWLTQVVTIEIAPRKGRREGVSVQNTQGRTIER